MTDKELIKQEIERRYNCEKRYPLDREANVAAAVLQELLLFIDSIQEPAREDLEEEIENYIKDSLAIKFPTTNKEQIKADIRYIARHFAEWQKQQMKEALQTEYEKGRFDMRDELMKDAVILHDKLVMCYSNGNPIGLSPYENWYENEEVISKFKDGDNVKIIIIKEEQQ